MASSRAVIGAALASVLHAGVLASQSGAAALAEWTRPTFPAAEYVARRQAAIALLDSTDVLIVPGAEGTSAGETFRQVDDFEYFVGLEVPRSVLVIDGRRRRSTLYVPPRDPRFDNPGRPNDFPGRILLDDPLVRDATGIDTVVADGELAAVLDAFVAGGRTLRLDLGSAARTIPTAVPAFGTLTAGETMSAFIHGRWPGAHLGNAYALIARLRMIKSAREIAIMRRAAQMTAAAIVRGASRVRAGVDERTLTGQFLADCAGQGSQRAAFTPIIKSGPNSLWPWRILGAHYDRRNRVLGDGELVIYDVGCEVDHYSSDVGRTFPVSGRFTPRQRELVTMVRTISDAVIAAARPGITLADLQRVATAAVPPAARRFMQTPLYFGHHIGLDAGDPSLPDAVLAPGMIITIEPWYYNHEDGVAVFIEDDLLITASGCENLTASLPRDADGLERLRRAH